MLTATLKSELNEDQQKLQKTTAGLSENFLMSILFPAPTLKAVQTMNVDLKAILKKTLAKYCLRKLHIFTLKN